MIVNKYVIIMRVLTIVPVHLDIYRPVIQIVKVIFFSLFVNNIKTQIVTKLVLHILMYAENRKQP